MAVTSYILIEAGPGTIKDVLSKILTMDGVLEAHAVTGPFDAIVKVDSEDVVKLGDMVVAKIQSVKGVLRTTTCICTG